MTGEKPFTWHDFLELAEKISEISIDNIEEARARTIISRAYYACFHKALNFLKEKRNFKEDTNGHIHKQVLDALRFYIPELADKFNDLLDDRVKADYTFEERIKIKKAKEVVLRSKEVYRIIREMYKSSP